MEVRSWKTPHGSCASTYFAEAAFDGIGGTDGLSFIEGRVAEAGEEIVEIVAQAFDGGGVRGFPALSEAAGKGTGLREVRGVDDGVEGSLDGGLVGLFDLVEDVADLVSPAALDRDVWVDGREGGEEAFAAVGADHLEVLSFEAAAEEVREEQLPLGGALGGGPGGSREDRFPATPR